MSINHRQYLFCMEYIKDYNATQAYIRAGYSKDGAGQSADRLLKNAEIITLISELERNRLKAIRQDADKIKADIADIKEKCINEGDAANALRASELLGRGVLWEKGGGGIKNISSKPDGTINISFNEDGNNTTDQS